MKNKQPNGQTFGPKMARALLVRCNNLEDAVVSQQKLIAQLRSEIANNNLAHVLMAKRYEDMKTFVELNRPDVERLIRAQSKRKAVEIAMGGALPQIVMKVVKKKKKVRVPESVPLSQADQDALDLEAGMHIAESETRDPHE